MHLGDVVYLTRDMSLDKIKFHRGDMFTVIGKDDNHEVYYFRSNSGVVVHLDNNLFSKRKPIRGSLVAFGIVSIIIAMLISYMFVYN